MKLQNGQCRRKCSLDDLSLILFTSQKMQIYSENEKAFLLIHLNLNYGTDLLPYTRNNTGDNLQFSFFLVQILKVRFVQ